MCLLQLSLTIITWNNPVNMWAIITLVSTTVSRWRVPLLPQAIVLLPLLRLPQRLTRRITTIGRNGWICCIGPSSQWLITVKVTHWRRPSRFCRRQFVASRWTITRRSMTVLTQQRLILANRNLLHSCHPQRLCDKNNPFRWRRLHARLSIEQFYERQEAPIMVVFAMG